MLVMKFGGTSVTNKASVEAIVALIHRELNRQPVLVVSALSGVTDLLVKLSEVENKQDQLLIIEQIKAKHSYWIQTIFEQQLPHNNVFLRIDEYLNELQTTLKAQHFGNKMQRHDSIVAFGEKMSSFLLVTYLESHKINAKQVLATECIITTADFGNADFIDEPTQEHSQKTLLPLIKANIVPVVTGFIGATVTGETTVLGRGGSDYSAAIIGYAIGSEEIQIWTDVNGVYSADPRVINDAKLIQQLSYQEAAELAMFGAKVLHPRTIQPAVRSGIPVRVLNTFNLDNAGTLIEHASGSHDGMVKAITWRNSVPLLNIYSAEMFLSKGFLQKIFAVMANNNISVNMLSASEVSVSITLDNTGKLDQALTELNEFAETNYLDGYGSISLIGEKVMAMPMLMQEAFDLLDATATKVEMLSYNASNINLSMIVPSGKIAEIVPLLHKNFIIQ